jgi:hypothetical protein
MCLPQAVALPPRKKVASAAPFHLFRQLAKVTLMAAVVQTNLPHLLLLLLLGN